MSDPLRRTEWQRRYDESVARERAARKEADELADPVATGFQAAWSAPGLLGVLVLVVTGIAATIRRLRKHV